MPRRPLPTAPVVRRHRRHGLPLRQPDRRALELDGWRTTLDFVENHRRRRDGRLLDVAQVWRADAERVKGIRRGADPRRGVDVISATAATADEVWSRLRFEAELADVRVVDGRLDTRVAGSP